MPIPGVTVEDVDAYSDVSNGSTISVGSAASGGSGHMPRPPSGGSRRSKSVQGRRSRVAKSPYSNSQLKGSSKQQPPKPAARNMWITAMRNGTATLSTENSPMKSLSGSRASHSKHTKTGTRARHLSDYVQIEDLKTKNHVRSASMSASEPYLSGGGPAYKPQEDYYDEIIELKKIINALKAENNIINTKLHRVEGENVLKDRKMEDLLNTRKQPEDVRRTLTDKKGDTSAIVTSLKQKLHAVERTVKDKETELSQLKKDIKMTNIEELQIQSETYYQEVQRLQLAFLEVQQSQVHDYFGKTSSPRNNTFLKGKPSTVSLQRLAEENDHLKAENRSLKKDLMTAIENASSGSKRVPLKAEYADMNRGQLLAKIRELEEKAQDSDGKKTLTRKGSLPEDKESDVEVRRKSVSKLAADVPGRMELKGTTSQKMAQLQEREVELLEEREKQREVIERLKEDRAHYRSVADDLRLQLKSTEEELDRLRGEKGVPGERRRSSTSVTSPTRKPSIKDAPPQDDNDEDLDRMLNDFQQQRAAKALQRQWRGYQGRKKLDIQEQERQNQAASTLQKNWRKHRDKTKQNEEEDKEGAITEIQAALRGQAVRNKYIEQLDKELEFTDRDDALVTIQSAMRAHSARKRHLGYPGDEIESRDTRTRGSSSHNLLDSDPESDEGLVTKASSSKRHPEPAITGRRRSSLTDPQDSTGHEVLAPSPTQVATAARDSALTRDSTLNQHALARDQAVALREPAHDKTFAPARLARHQALVTSALARDPSESDSDDDAVVIGRSVKSRTSNQTHDKSVERNERTSGVNKKDPQGNAKKSRGKKKAAKQSAKKEDGDGEKSNMEEGSRRSLITAPRFSNISEHSEEDDALVTSPSRSRSIQKRSGGLLNESTPKGTEQRPNKKTFEIVDSDEDDDDDTIVAPRRRSLDTGLSQQRPSLSRSSQARSPPAPSPRETSRVTTVENRPGLSRSTRQVAVNRDLADSEDENLQRPDLSRSKRPLSGQRPSLNRSGDRETENSRASSLRRSSLPVGSEEDSDEDDVIMTGKKTKSTGGDKKTARPSLTRKSPASTLPVSSQRGSIASSLDNFFSSTVPSKDSGSKKSPRKTLAQFNDSDDDDEDDDDDEIVVSSLSRSKSKQMEKSSARRQVSQDSVADLWATSDKGSDSKSKRKSSIKSSSSNKWNQDFEFEKPSRRPGSQLDELF